MEIKMPKLDVTMTEGTFLGWLVPDGASVSAGEDLYTVGTDKVQVDVPAPCDGVLRHGDIVEEAVYPVGTTLGVVLT
ncbi:biotin-requiring enzyme family protein [Mycobacterium intermedium]|uniref:Biotin-requiring enzyme family protein n=1 Tax=Mycobacterium intermedium TaxID=28445 RepID=A0A1E3SL17_MYCIE|nr:biotin/lipoyl-containing protein [Mycobacterium intermedium]MCV6963465.1 biotin-requiring enzyme family protein [Mycobacterium intermedium]ODR02850.1 biotin-requiring enzyme family protein [Mycobacterium intermedium]OPE49922.1 biotin-requiring enzyme family protein [Mycobacterium intermedium]ORB02773.1 biotin-requiring enzyme family protein [Mycobacterium intermedium]